MSKPDDSPTSNGNFLNDQREELTELLRSRLIECGWRDQVSNMCRSLIQKHGVEQVRLEQMINEVGPKARQSVPDKVKAELLDIIRKEMKPTSIEKAPQPAQQLLQKQSIMKSNDESFL